MNTTKKDRAVIVSFVGDGMALRRNIVGVSPNHKRYEIHDVYGDRMGGRPPAENGGPRCKGRGQTGGLAKPWPCRSSGYHSVKQRS